MDLRPGRLIGLMCAAVVGMIALAMVLEAAGGGAALAVAIGAIVVLVGSYARVLVVAIRATGDEDARKHRLQTLTRTHLPIVAGTPLVIMAAHPWGTASLAVAFGTLAAGQVLFLHALLVAGLILRRRSRGTSPG